MKFWKMHGLGNDYIVIDNRDQKIDEKNASKLAKKLCERHFSIGADGLLLVSNSTVADVKMQIFNADGSQAEMCGNGIRCFAKYCFENKITNKTEFSVETLAGVKKVWLTLANQTVKTIKVDMGKPDWDRKALPMQGEGTCIYQDLEVEEGEHYNVTCLSLGNPHCIIFVENVDEFPVEYVGPLIENHEVFPKRTNVGFSQVLNKNETKAESLGARLRRNISLRNRRLRSCCSSKQPKKSRQQSHSSCSRRRPASGNFRKFVFKRTRRESFRRNIVPRGLKRDIRVR